MNDTRDNAGRFATKPATRVREERRAAIYDTLHALREYRDVEHAAMIMLGSVTRQARWLPDRETSGPVLIEVPA